MTEPIRVLLADDQALVRGALATLLSVEPDMLVVAQVGRGDEVCAAAANAQAHVAVLDIEMPGCSGIDAAALLREQVPTCAALMVTTFARPGYVKRALAAGARGFMGKDAPAAELARAVRAVHAGGLVVAPELAVASMAAGDNPLTERERQVLAAAQSGGSVRAIAGELHLSQGTVRNYVSSAIAKLGASTRVEAATVAAERGWL